mmetsp:Transcript_425/g.846  ORF Transcript_425/g.846 Transcript_425/m.846 type:complete len:260 (+) Transcript_425:317-1096(+)
MPLPIADLSIDLKVHLDSWAIRSIRRAVTAKRRWRLRRLKISQFGGYILSIASAGTGSSCPFRVPFIDVNIVCSNQVPNVDTSLGKNWVDCAGPRTTEQNFEVRELPMHEDVFGVQGKQQIPRQSGAEAARMVEYGVDDKWAQFCQLCNLFCSKGNFSRNGLASQTSDNVADLLRHPVGVNELLLDATFGAGSTTHPQCSLETGCKMLRNTYCFQRACNDGNYTRSIAIGVLFRQLQNPLQCLFNLFDQGPLQGFRRIA